MAPPNTTIVDHYLGALWASLILVPLTVVENLHQSLEPVPTGNCTLLLQKGLFCLICIIAAPQGNCETESNRE